MMFVLRAWRPAVPMQDALVNRFSEVNRAYWNSDATGAPGILVEGHLAEYGPNYLFRTGLAAKAVQAALGGGNIIVVVNGFSYHWQSAIKGYASFGIKEWIFLGRKFLLFNPLLFLIACLQAGLRFFAMRTPQHLLDIHLGGIRVGDLIYDEVLRANKRPTIHKLDWAVYKAMARSYFYYYQYQLLFSSGSYRYLIATHTAYPEYGLLCRVALLRKVAVIETSDIQMSSYDTIGENDLPTYHQGINSEIRAALAASQMSANEREELARASLRRRLDSEIKQIDAQKAYTGKVYTADELRRSLHIPSGHRIGFVVTHVFCDSPHLSSSMLHADYYRWLESTIDCCAESTGVTWVVKPHPSCALYKEEGMVEALVVAKGASNIHICPKDLNTSSLLACADVLLTVHGTAGLEYACFGIPTILAGTPFYAGFGFTQEPQTAEAYAAAVRDARLLGRLSEPQIRIALQVFEAWERQFDWDNSIVTTEVLAHVWGNGADRDLIRAYELLTENLRVNNPKDLKLWKFVDAVVGGTRQHG
jgi:hypothetical protein